MDRPVNDTAAHRGERESRGGAYLVYRQHIHYRQSQQYRQHYRQCKLYRQVNLELSPPALLHARGHYSTLQVTLLTAGQNKAVYLVEKRLLNAVLTSLLNICWVYFDVINRENKTTALTREAMRDKSVP